MGERFPKTSNSQDFGESFQVRKRQEAKISSANQLKRLHLGSLRLANRPEARTLAARGKGVRPFGGQSNLNCKSHARRGSAPFCHGPARHFATIEPWGLSADIKKGQDQLHRDHIIQNLNSDRNSWNSRSQQVFLLQISVPHFNLD